MSFLRFGDPLPPLAGKGHDLVEAGWHPTCLHVRHLGVGEHLGLSASPALVYGLLPRADAMARLGECEACKPPDQLGLAL